jgi:hypothetical protein
VEGARYAANIHQRDEEEKKLLLLLKQLLWIIETT